MDVFQVFIELAQSTVRVSTPTFKGMRPRSDW